MDWEDWVFVVVALILSRLICDYLDIPVGAMALTFALVAFCRLGNIDREFKDYREAQDLKNRAINGRN